MNSISLTVLIVSGLASWRYAYLIIGDSITENLRNNIIDRYEKFAFKRLTRSEKKIRELRIEQASFQECLDYADRNRHSKDADRYEEIVQDIEEEIRAIKPKRTINQNIWIKLTILLSCIYCMTFWTSLLVYAPFVWIRNIGAIWGLATVIGLAHNKFFTAPELDEDKVE